MARKSSAKSTRSTAKRAKRPVRATAAPKAAAGFKIPAANLGDLSKMAKVLTPEQAFDLYRANARMALDVIDAAIESTAKLRKHQFAGEEEARSMQKRALRHAAEAADPQAFMAAGQSVTQDAGHAVFKPALETSLAEFHYLPGAKEAKAAMAMMPDLRQAQNLVKAMQGVMSSGGSTFESMQRVMGDFTRFVKP